MEVVDVPHFRSRCLLVLQAIQEVLFMYFRYTDRKSRTQSTLVKRMKYYVPSLGWIPSYSLSLYVLVPNIYLPKPAKLCVLNL